MEVGLSVRDGRGSKRKGWEVGMGMGSGRGQERDPASKHSGLPLLHWCQRPSLSRFPGPEEHWPQQSACQDRPGLQGLG